MTHRTVQDMFLGEQTLVPAALRGYRTWAGVSVDGRLLSNGIQHRWQVAPFSGARETAICRGLVAQPHTSPDAKHCRCGLYGWYDPADTRIVPGAIFGAIAATGRAILGTHGFRTQHAEVLGVTSDDPLVRSMLWQLGYPVFDSRKALLAALPPDDVSGLVEHDCDGSCTDLTGHAVIGWSIVLPATTSAMQALAHAAARLGVTAAEVAKQLQALGIAILDSDQAEADDELEPTDPKERALQLQQHRNTGPARPSLFRSALARAARERRK